MAQTSRISKNNTTVMRDAHGIIVTLHSTPVVTINYLKNTVLYNTGGWDTATTVCRMNQASNELKLPYRVSRAGGKMTARNYKTGQEFDFTGNTLELPLQPLARMPLYTGGISQAVVVLVAWQGNRLRPARHTSERDLYENTN